MKILLCIFLAFACLEVRAQQTYTISGTVTYGKGETLPGATVFLTNTKKATATDGTGKFILSGLAPGTYELNIKMIGFEPNIQTIIIRDKAVTVNAYLKESNTTLNTVSINAKPDPKRNRYLKQFIRSFIGESVNAGLCKILNPEVLNFDYNSDKNTLIVTATDLLVIQNDGLGYQLKYLLTKFKYYGDLDIAIFEGNPYFEELKGTDAQQAKWNDNRRIAYLGSYKHFFRSIINHTAKQEGFEIYKYQYHNEADPIKYLNYDSVFVSVNKNTRALLSSATAHTAISKGDTAKWFYVAYQNAKEPSLFFRTGAPLAHPATKYKSFYQLSRVRTFADTLYIDDKLLINPTYNLTFAGYWAWQRIAEATPLDYFSGAPPKSKSAEPVIRDTVLNKIMAAVDTLHKQQTLEKLYLHTDRPYYANGDTMRFKAYLLNEALAGSTKSGIMYVELINDSGRVCKRQTILVKNSMAWGDIVVKNSWSPGSYTLRAYTNWMKNFGTDQFFTRPVGIVPAGNASWVVNEHAALDKDKNASVALRFSDIAHKTIGFKDLQISIRHGSNTLAKYKARTGPQGDLDVKFALPDKLTDEPLTILAEDISGSGQKTIIPVLFNRSENIDLQFMPEGGNIIAGLPNRIAFKAIGEGGKGIDVAGKIINSKQQEVAIFKSAHKGMGSFEFTPQAGENYTAKLSTGDGIKTYALPIVNVSGIALRINTVNSDSLEVTINAAGVAPATYYLVGQARDKAFYGAKIMLKASAIHKKIAQNIFPTGVVKFALLDLNNRPVTQRIVFIDYNDRLKINLTTNKESYLLRDSIGATLAITDADGSPVQGSFSLAVTDDSQAKTFDEDAANIATHVLLSADLKGNIEEPGYYFNKEHTGRAAALDNLLLTQGWTSYSWEQAFNPPKLVYDAEADFKVKGRVSNLVNGSTANTDVMLISTKPTLLVETKTGKDGRFSFGDFPFLDTINFHLQTRKGFNVGLVVDEFVPVEFTPLKYAATPWYINSDSIIVNYINKKQIEQDEHVDPSKSKLLREVEIKGQRVEPPAPPLFALNEEEIRLARPGKKLMTIWDLLNNKEKYGRMDKRLIIDGEMLYESMPRQSPPATNAQITAWLEGFNTDEIKSISARQIQTDKKEYGRIGLLINVTTNIKFGDRKIPAGSYVYRPLPISWPHQFYSPRYTATTPVVGKDRRTTIYWDPNIVTDASGKVEENFYSADTPGTYTVIVEGTDMNGNIGYGRQKIKVEGSKTAAVK